MPAGRDGVETPPPKTLWQNDRLMANPITSLSLRGGRPSLDFVNTIDPRDGPNARDFLRSYTDLIAWAEHAGVATGREVSSLNRAARRSPSEAHKVFRRAVELREALYGLFIGASRTADCRVVERELVAAYARLRLERQEGRMTLAPRPNDLSRPIMAVVLDAADLLTSTRHERIRRCASAGECGWVFLDVSKNGTRRWCSMAVCGNRQKMRRRATRART